jgi:membrane fusion protein (multidrug efflux system)
MGYRTIVFYGHHATTEDAQTDGHIDPVLPRVSGYVSEVRVQENQPVQAGDVLVVVDPSDLQAKVDQEQAAVLNAEAAVAVARANVEAARTRRVQAGADVARYQALYSKEEVSTRDYDAVKATSDASAAQLDAMQRGVAAAQAQVAQHRATLNAAKLQISYATVKAPAPGMVSKKR